MYLYLSLKGEEYKHRPHFSDFYSQKRLATQIKHRFTFPLLSVRACMQGEDEACLKQIVYPALDGAPGIPVSQGAFSCGASQSDALQAGLRKQLQSLYPSHAEGSLQPGRHSCTQELSGRLFGAQLCAVPTRMPVSCPAATPLTAAPCQIWSSPRCLRFPRPTTSSGTPRPHPKWVSSPAFATQPAAPTADFQTGQTWDYRKLLWACQSQEMACIAWSCL